MTTDRNSVLKCAEHLVDAGRFDLAIAEFERFVREQPDDGATAAILADLFLRAGETAAAEGRPCDLTSLSVVANWREARGDQAGAAKLRARLDGLELADIEAQIGLARGATGVDRATEQPHPSVSKVSLPHAQDVKARAACARDCVARGDAVGAAEYLMPEMADGDPSLLLTIAEIQLRGGFLDRGIALVERVLADDPAFAGAVAGLGVELAARQPDAGFLLVEMAANTWLAQSQWRAAIGAFEELAAQAPDCTPALVRLQDILAAAPHATDEKRVIPFRPLSSSCVRSRTA